MEPIDNTDILETALQLHEMAELLIARLDAVVKDTPAKVETYEMIKTVVTMQDNAIRALVDNHVEIGEHLDKLLEKIQPN